MEHIDQQLIELRYLAYRKQHLCSHQHELEEKLKRETATLARYQASLEKEQEDVERLERTSITRILSSLSGKGALLLEKEKAEVIRASLDYKTKLKEIEYVEYELNLLQQELLSYQDIDVKRQSLMELKRKMLKEEAYLSVKTLEAQLLQLETQIHCIQDAIPKGEQVLSSLILLLESLSELVEETSDAKSLLYPVVSQEQMDEVMKEVMIMPKRWEAFETVLQTTGVALPREFDEAFLQKVYAYMEDLQMHQHQATKRINITFENLNAMYFMMKEVLGKLEQALLNHRYMAQNLSYRIDQTIEQG